MPEGLRFEEWQQLVCGAKQGGALCCPAAHMRCFLPAHWQLVVDGMPGSHPTNLTHACACLHHCATQEQASGSSSEDDAGYDDQDLSWEAVMQAMQGGGAAGTAAEEQEEGAAVAAAAAGGGTKRKRKQR